LPTKPIALKTNSIKEHPTILSEREDDGGGGGGGSGVGLKLTNGYHEYPKSSQYHQSSRVLGSIDSSSTTNGVDNESSTGGAESPPNADGIISSSITPPSSNHDSSSSSSSASSTSSTANSNNPTNTKPTPLMDDDELKKSLSNQLEFYFSRENLLHDKYLLSQMDNDNYVPLTILASFNMIKKLFSNSLKFGTTLPPETTTTPPTTTTTTSPQPSDDSLHQHIEFMIDAIKTYSSQLQLDTATNAKLRANHKRCVVILREIEKDTPLDEIMGLFDKCAIKCLHCEFAGNRSWYLSFKDELEAQIAVQFLKEEVQTFRGECLFARIKTHPIPRSSLTSSSSSVKSSSAAFSSTRNAESSAVVGGGGGANENEIDSMIHTIKSPLLSTKSDATDDDYSAFDFVSPQPKVIYQQPLILPQTQQHQHPHHHHNHHHPQQQQQQYQPLQNHTGKINKPNFSQEVNMSSSSSNHQSSTAPQQTPHQPNTIQQQQQSQNIQYQLGGGHFPYNPETFKYYLSPSRHSFKQKIFFEG
jgi:hypothetical protein